MITVTVCSAKGGVGKTSVTLGLASAALHRSLSTLVVDLDPQADATSGLDVTAQRAHDVAAVLRTPKRRVAESAVAPSGWVDDHPGLLDVVSGSAASAGLDAPDPQEADLEGLRRALRKLDDHQLALLDCPPSLGGLTRSAWRASDAVVVVSDASRFSVAAVGRTLDEIAALRSGPRVAGVLVNRYSPRSGEQRFRLEELRSLFGDLVLEPLPDRVAVPQSQGAGKPLHALRPVAARRVAEQFDRLLDVVLDQRARPRTRPSGHGG
ncbi:ParA family protein [Kineococcus auxinigenes]|uniref:ParA family protein n=1 Tax=unclassified Kineococcus TaxID=2621656 RepID=UPI003D7C3CE5